MLSSPGGKPTESQNPALQSRHKEAVEINLEMQAIHLSFECLTQQGLLSPSYSSYSLCDRHSVPFAVSHTCTVDSAPEPVSPCYDGSHTCDTTAKCRPGAGIDYTCECTPGFQGDGRSCVGKRHICFCHVPLVLSSTKSVEDKWYLWSYSCNDFNLCISRHSFMKTEAESG